MIEPIVPTTTIVAWHGDPALKAATIAEMAAHREADELIRGLYWDGHRGCAVGCLTKDPRGGHDQYPTRWGIPVELAWLKDTLVGGLPEPDWAAWPERFLGAIQPGADLTGVHRVFAARLMLDPEHGNVARCTGYPDVEAAVRRVGDLLARTDVSDEARSAARSAAWSAALSASELARSAAWSAWSAPESAARSAMESAWSATRAAAEAAGAVEWPTPGSAEAAGEAAGLAHYQWMANILIDAIDAAPMATGGAA